MKASEIITKARYTLSDTDEVDPRWSDARLLSLLNDALLDIALTTRLYNANGYIKLQQNTAIYDVSSFAVKVERVEHLSLPLEKVSFEEMDIRHGDKWQEIASVTPTNIVYDLKRSGEFRVYPVPIDGSADFIEATSDFGIVTSLNYEDVDLQVIDDFGDIDFPNLAEYIRLYYIRLPAEITAVTDDLESVIDRTMLSSLAHYVSGAALRDNMDTRNRQVGNEELTFYEGKKQRLIEQKMKGNVKRVRTVQYRGME